MILYVTRAIPSADGGGGARHRSYQVQWQLEHAFGSEVKTLCCADDVKFWRLAKQAPPVDLAGRGRFGHRFASLRLLRAYWRNPCFYRRFPFRLVVETGFTAAADAVKSAFLDQYRELVTADRRPQAVVLDDVRLGALVRINTEVGVPTVGCFHNLESLDAIGQCQGLPWGLPACLGDFAAEAEILAMLHSRLFISRVEAGMVGGIGLSAGHHPYAPVGSLRTRLEGIRALRAKGSAERGLIVTVGSMQHATTATSLQWLLQNVRRHGLPTGNRLVVVGRGTQGIAGEALPPGADVAGFLGQAEMDDLLRRAQAVLVLQRSGFGAVTRLADMSCAGIPVIASDHARHAIDPPPGVRFAGESWADWCAGIEESAGRFADAGAYETWDAQLERPLVRAVSEARGS